MAYAWSFPLIFERRFPITYVHTSFEEGSGSPPSSSSLFDEMNRMMASMHGRLEHMLGWQTFPVDLNDPDYDLPNDDGFYNYIDDYQLPVHDEVIDIEKKLDAVVPVCTTVTDSPTTISPRKSRRKKPPTTRTTTCIKELIVNGQKHFSEEVTTTDDKDVVIKQTKSTGAVSIEANPIQQ
jgi:hypothetical protein